MEINYSKETWFQWPPSIWIIQIYIIMLIDSRCLFFFYIPFFLYFFKPFLSCSHKRMCLANWDKNLALLRNKINASFWKDCFSCLIGRYGSRKREKQRGTTYLLQPLTAQNNWCMPSSSLESRSPIRSLTWVAKTWVFDPLATAFHVVSRKLNWWDWCHGIVH